MSAADVPVDVRLAAGGGVQLAIGPASVLAAPHDSLPWIFRLHYQSALELADAIDHAQMWRHVAGRPPDIIGIRFDAGQIDGEDWGELLRADLGAPGPADVQIRICFPLVDWRAIAGDLQDVARRRPDAEPVEYEPGAWQPEPFFLCCGCRRPVFDSDHTVLCTPPPYRDALVPACLACSLKAAS